MLGVVKKKKPVLTQKDKQFCVVDSEDEDFSDMAQTETQFGATTRTGFSKAVKLTNVSFFPGKT
jgi:hypothetical protein